MRLFLFVILFFCFSEVSAQESVNLPSLMAEDIEVGDVVTTKADAKVMYANKTLKTIPQGEKIEVLSVYKSSWIGVFVDVDGQKTFGWMSINDVIAAPRANSSIEGLSWHRWETNNFVILSIDEKQGRWLFDNIENIKAQLLSRWGLPNIDFPKREYVKGISPEPGCMILCVPNKEIMQKLWRRNKPFSEVREEDGKIVLNFSVLLLEDGFSKSIHKEITPICLKELEHRIGGNFGFWAYRGIAGLNRSPAQIRGDITKLERIYKVNRLIFFSKLMFEMTEDRMHKFPGHRELYDSEAMVLCLLLRKEFGQRKFLEFLTSDGTEDDFLKIYKFDSLDDFDLVLKRYIGYLGKDVEAGETPDNYLQVVPVKRR